MKTKVSPSSQGSGGRCPGPEKTGLTCGSPPLREARERKSDPYLTFLLPFTPPEKGALKMSLRHVAEKTLTYAWDTANSRFTEAGAQGTHVASALCSQEPQ